MIPVKIKLFPQANIPEYKSPGSAGADVFASLPEPVTLEPGDIKLIPTGIAVEIPEGYEAQIRPRSGLALNHGLTLLNTPGTIDSDYRGEVKIILANLGRKSFTVENGMRIAQMVFSRVYRAQFAVTEEISATERNEGGFGHTGT
ncbi:MAG: dUTP diphosphatase [Spirochaetota bacterium]